MSKHLLAAAALLCVLGGTSTDTHPWGTRAAHAIVGRPLTPVSYAGVARRTARRTTYAAAGAYAAVPHGYVAALPAGCVIAAGVYTCGTVRYRPYYAGPTVVYQVVP